MASNGLKVESIGFCTAVETKDCLGFSEKYFAGFTSNSKMVSIVPGHSVGKSSAVVLSAKQPIYSICDRLLKVISLCTVVIPLIFLMLKIIYRSTHSFHWKSAQDKHNYQIGKQNAPQKSLSSSHRTSNSRGRSGGLVPQHTSPERNLSSSHRTGNSRGGSQIQDSEQALTQSRSFSSHRIMSEEQHYMKSLKLERWLNSEVSPHKNEAVRLIIEFCISETETSLNLSGLELHSLPKCIKNLRNLKELRVANNYLKKLPKLDQVIFLECSNNQITKIPSSMVSLEKLYFKNNRVRKFFKNKYPWLREYEFDGNDPRTKIYFGSESSSDSDSTFSSNSTSSHSSGYSLPQRHRLGSYRKRLGFQNNRVQEFGPNNHPSPPLYSFYGNLLPTIIDRSSGSNSDSDSHGGMNVARPGRGIFPNRSQRRINGETPKEQLSAILEIYKERLSDAERRVLGHLSIDRFDERFCAHLKTWIGADYHGLLKLDIYSGFQDVILPVLQVIQYATQDVEWHTYMEFKIADVQQDCADRSLYYLNIIYTEFLIRKAESEKAKVKCLFDGFRLDSLHDVIKEKIIRARVIADPQNGHREELEVYLNLMNQFKEDFGFTIPSDIMLHYIVAHLTEDEIKLARRELIKIVNLREKAEEYFAKHPVWQNFLLEKRAYRQKDLEDYIADHSGEEPNLNDARGQLLYADRQTAARLAFFLPLTRQQLGQYPIPQYPKSR